MTFSGTINIYDLCGDEAAMQDTPNIVLQFCGTPNIHIIIIWLMNAGPIKWSIILPPGGCLPYSVGMIPIYMPASLYDHKTGNIGIHSFVATGLCVAGGTHVRTIKSQLSHYNVKLPFLHQLWWYLKRVVCINVMPIAGKLCRDNGTKN